MTSGAVITCVGLTRRFGTQLALDGLTLDAEPGEVVALLGPNGAGKTTTVRLLNGVLRPDAGRISVLGLDPTVDGDAVRARTGVLTEQSGLDDRLTALENVLAHARVRGMGRTEATAKGLALLDRFGMGARARVSTQGFSTGERKRVGLARALVHDPEVLFLDEPTSGLDPEATRDTLELIGELARDRGRTVILCTHFLAEAGRLCQRMAVLDQGRLLAFGRPADLAAGLGQGGGCDLDLGGPIGPELADVVRAVPGVLAVVATAAGAAVELAGREALPHIAAALAVREVPLYGMVPRQAGLEEVYFAVTRAATGG